MEQIRLFLAIGLSILVFLIWDFFFIEKPNINDLQQKNEKQLQHKIDKSEPFIQETIIDSKNKIPISDEKYLQSGLTAKKITVDTPLYRVKLSEKGGGFDSYLLKKYYETAADDSPLKELISYKLKKGTIVTEFADNSLPNLAEAVFKSNSNFEYVNVSDQSQTISFVWTSPKGIVVEKIFFFSPDSYNIGLIIKIKNGSETAFKDKLTLSLLNTIPVDNKMFGFIGPSSLIDNAVKQIEINEKKEKNFYNGNIKWISIEDGYFMSAIIPHKSIDASIRLFQYKDDIIENKLILPECIINSKTAQTFQFNLFLGPKKTDVLNTIGYDLNKVINYGWFDFIAKPCLWLMNIIYTKIYSNYGFSIILLTILIKLVFWPLGTLSYKSMNEMKKIQPLMLEIREKHKNDKKKMNEEIMGLYKTYKVNPLGGCLPTVAQIPVFFALYRMLYQAIELRHAPFLWWINDLSAPDRLFNFSFTIPFMEPPYGIPVLTIIMGGTMLIQQKMSPPPGDPTQAKMMMFLPIVFTFIFINFSSGLVLYWLVNNILSIMQQYYISKKTA